MRNRGELPPLKGLPLVDEMCRAVLCFPVEPGDGYSGGVAAICTREIGHKREHWMDAPGFRRFRWKRSRSMART